MTYRIKKGQVYMADLNPVRGSEQGGVRPVIIVQNNQGNMYSPTVIVAPLTSKNKKAIPTHVHLEACSCKSDSTVLLEQIRTIDKSRLIEKIGEATCEEMEKIDKALRVSVDV